jgi:hypothetical protein
MARIGIEDKQGNLLCALETNVIKELHIPHNTVVRIKGNLAITGSVDGYGTLAVDGTISLDKPFKVETISG